ncbi:MAG: tRNA (adenosine(37)-N6)-threonylcarbamoyltransferase complex dimerization subunit type 1 TsaB [Saprospiraceae bacterium]
MTRILLIETATDICSVALAEGGESRMERSGQSNHAAQITVFIQDCMQALGWTYDSLDAVALSRGPGSYTGLRVGASVAKGICEALDIPLIAVDTLQAMAWGARQVMPSAYASPVFVPMLDARRQEVWTQIFGADLSPLSPALPLVAESADALLDFVGKFSQNLEYKWIFFLGNGTVKIKSVSLPPKSVFSPVKNSASHLAHLAQNKFEQSDFEEVSYFEPFYMKPPHITTPSVKLG